MAVKRDLVAVGFGVVIKNSASLIMLTVGKSIKPGMDAMFGEAFVLHYDLQLSKDVGFTRIVVETNC